MAKPKYLYEAGFLGTGAVSQTFLVEAPGLPGILGPVYTPARRATPRVVTALGNGFSAASLEEVKGCRHLLVCASPADSRLLLEEALNGDVLAGVESIALVESSTEACLPAAVISSVREVGKIRALPTRKRRAYALEGSLRFRRFCQRLLDAPLSRLVMTKPESRAVVDAGLFLAEEICLPLLEATQAAFLGAGIPREQARELGAELLREAIESASFAGKKRWTGILHSRDARRLTEILRALQRENAPLANLVLGFSREGLAAMGKDSDWVPQLASGPAGHFAEAGAEQAAKKVRGSKSSAREVSGPAGVSPTAPPPA